MSKHHELPLGHCCGCLPIRTGVLVYSIFILFLSFCAVAGIVSEDTRVLVGGYTQWTHTAVDILGCLGVVFSLLSIVGLHDNHPRWVKFFLYYAILRVIARFFIFWSDVNMLDTCETLGLTSVNGYYNPAMEAVKLTNRCHSTTYIYWFVSLFDILVSLYAIYMAWTWCSYVENTPMYHISIDDSKPLRIYTGYSTVGHPERTVETNVVPPTAAPLMYGATMGPPASFGHPSAAYSSRHLYPTGAIPGTLPPGTLASIPQ
mmetsp:Transcript_105748/g.166943  ORF Transcript_105748/g.166943 Transcript_105748/m.166943 type:complete len:260 (-) Transcript_105748:50-829(-)|eukprot:CAMPEP_0169077784 /NCGR_PEP_ID=MMETSP1015-20121227/9063_1 /TAXON_ID=342587 /ORGANISM="Karlodinium micrum, Strain CCMP2283" /LENGTH=259 /DNA_ID=CAMNT_0009137331 /DNA_START=167 /DNA_END=946 /DNA_ORIENTATION=+